MHTPPPVSFALVLLADLQYNSRSLFTVSAPPPLVFCHFYSVSLGLPRKADPLATPPSPPSLEKITVDELVAEITPRGRATVPEKIKNDLLQDIRKFLQST